MTNQSPSPLPPPYNNNTESNYSSTITMMTCQDHPPATKYKFMFDHFKFRKFSVFCTNPILTNWQIDLLKLVRKYVLFYPCVMFATWALFYILFGEDQAYPGGGLFSLFVLEVFAIILGELMELIYLPPLLGMLAAGLILRNVPAISEIATDLPSNLSAPLRAMSVVILLTRGAFSVNPTAILNFRRVVPHLAVISCVAEAVAGGLAVYFIIQFPLQWSALMGCILSAMSGVAVMPFLLMADTFKDGNQNNVVTIAKTGCGLDAILAICLAEFALGFIFADGDLREGLTKGVAEVAMGGAFGLFWGTLAGTLLDDNNCLEIRTFAVFAGGCMSLLGLTTIGYPRGGPLGVFSGSLVTSVLWRFKQFDGKNNDKINENFTKLWFFFQPLLFGIIGCRTDFSTVNWTILTKAMICIAISLTVRLVTATSMCSWACLTWRQKMFIAVSWIPKGTVQAALGPVALDTAKEIGFGPQSERLGYQVMNIAVLTIIVASSLGSVTLLTLGPRLLNKSSGPT